VLKMIFLLPSSWAILTISITSIGIIASCAWSHAAKLTTASTPVKFVAAASLSDLDSQAVLW
jgi:hypothetical protein